jgi:hypothetical protein
MQRVQLQLGVQMFDLAIMIGVVSAVLTCSVVFARVLLSGHARAMNRPALIRWRRLFLVALPTGAAFASAWMIPAILLVPHDEGLLSLGYAFLVSVAATQAILFIPILCVLPSIASVVLIPETPATP